jgi:hypothetical protein
MAKFYKGDRVKANRELGPPGFWRGVLGVQPYHPKGAILLVVNRKTEENLEFYQFSGSRRWFVGQHFDLDQRVMPYTEWPDE